MDVVSAWWWLVVNAAATPAGERARRDDDYDRDLHPLSPDHSSPASIPRSDYPICGMICVLCAGGEAVLGTDLRAFGSPLPAGCVVPLHAERILHRLPYPEVRPMTAIRFFDRTHACLAATCWPVLRRWIAAFGHGCRVWQRL